MPSHHSDIELVAGDDWIIDFALLDEDGVTPLDLTGAEIAWTFLNPDGTANANVINNADIQINVPNTAGTGVISISADWTASLDPGRFRDAIRVFSDTKITDTLWTGAIDVDANPFAIPAV